jgi:hypothetical protein
MTPFDHVKLINKHEYTDDLTGYVPRVINKVLSLILANDMNTNYDLDLKLQYDYLFHSVRPRKRNWEWIKDQRADADVDAVREYYGYNIQKARQALMILDKAQLAIIKKKLIRGGL